MKSMILYVIVGLITLISATAKEESRNWKDTKGRIIRGTLKEKTATTASILLESNAKITVISLDKLSPEDRKYVETADVFPLPVMTARTEKVQSNAADTKYDSRGVAVTLSKTHGRNFKVDFLFLGADKGSPTLGIYKRQQASISIDGKYMFSTVYRYKSELRFDDDYRGFAVRVTDEEGNEIARTASQKPFERFLDSMSSAAVEVVAPESLGR